VTWLCAALSFGLIWVGRDLSVRGLLFLALAPQAVSMVHAVWIVLRREPRP